MTNKKKRVLLNLAISSWWNINGKKTSRFENKIYLWQNAREKELWYKI